MLTKLLRAINKKTSLFPDVRSLILGYWYDRELDDNYCHIAIAVGINDKVQLLILLVSKVKLNTLEVRLKRTVIGDIMKLTLDYQKMNITLQLY